MVPLSVQPRGNRVSLTDSPTLRRAQLLMRRGAGFDLAPVIQHRHNLAACPSRVLVIVAQAAGLAGCAMENEPIAIIPVTDVESLAQPPRPIPPPPHPPSLA